MMLVKAKAAPSRVHGIGLFACHFIPAGTILWRFRSPDFRIPVSLASVADLHYGYVNPERPDWVVCCGDLARFWNFGLCGAENSGISRSVLDDGESGIIAMRDIAMGEELLITVDSDADATRKLTLF